MDLQGYYRDGLTKYMKVFTIDPCIMYTAKHYRGVLPILGEYRIKSIYTHIPLLKPHLRMNQHDRAMRVTYDTLERAWGGPILKGAHCRVGWGVPRALHSPEASATSREGTTAVPGQTHPLPMGILNALILFPQTLTLLVLKCELGPSS